MSLPVRVLVVVVVIACVCAGPAGAAEKSPEERLESLERQVEELRRELAEARRAGALPSERLAEIERRIALLAREIEKLRIGQAAEEGPLTSRHGLGPAASKVYGKARGVSIGGYGEVLYEDVSGTRDDGARSGKTDQADFLRAVLYFGYKWTDRLLFNSEIEYEHASTGKDGEVSVEFATIDFLAHERAALRAGMVLVPLGFVNEMHEPPVFLGARRPDVERAIIPATWREIGAGVYGDWGPLSYRGYLLTSLDASEFSASGIRGGRQKGSKARAEDLAVTARLDWSAAPGLTVGAAVFTGDTGQGLTDGDLRPIGARTTLLEGHAEWKWRGVDLRALFVRTRIADASRLNDALGLTGSDSIGRRQSGWYGQAGYDVLLASGRTEHALVPFVRYEEYDTQDRVPGGFLRDPARDIRVTTFGLSWKPIVNVVVKADFQDVDNAEGTGTDQVNLALGFMF